MLHHIVRTLGKLPRAVEQGVPFISLFFSFVPKCDLVGDTIVELTLAYFQTATELSGSNESVKGIHTAHHYCLSHQLQISELCSERRTYSKS